MPLDDATRTRLTKLCGLLGSDHDGERATAAAMATALLKTAGLDWDTIFRSVVLPAPPADDPAVRGTSARGGGTGNVSMEWQESAPKDGRPGFWRRHWGVTLGVRQNRPSPNRSPGWTANIDGELLDRGDGKPMFFPCADDAMIAADEKARLRFGYGAP